MAYPTHLIKVNSRFYYKIKVPVDLSHLFPCKFIKKSLHTNHLNSAKTMLVSSEFKTHNAFALLRTGVLASDYVQLLVRSLLPSQKVPEKMVGKLLSEVIANYTAEKQSGWTDKTKMEVAGVFKMIVDILGDIDITSITRPMMVELRSSLLRVPPNFYVKFPKGSLLRDSLLPPSEAGLSIKTVNKHMSRIGSLMKYCHELAYIPLNPATGLQFADGIRADQERSAYSLEDVKNIVANLPRDISCPEKYWIPLIGMFNGLRLAEICQLHEEDIFQVDGHWCFNINGLGNKQLKNTASERVIPIHPKLITLGFMDYVENIRKNKLPRLWMNLSYINLHGYTNSFGKWYARFNREHITQDKLKTFHSMRHLFADTLKQQGVQESLIAELMGHANGSITTGRYGKRYKPEVLLGVVKLVDHGLMLP